MTNNTITKNQTNAARKWLARAQQTLSTERYQNLLPHLLKRQGARLTKRACILALVDLWAEEGLPNLEVAQ